MVHIELLRSEDIPAVVKAKDLDSVNALLLSMMGNVILSKEAITALLGEASYANKIESLPHQKKTVLEVLNNFSHRALLADEVGLGKTIEAGMIIKEFLARGLIQNVLILTPATLKFQWQEEMRSKFGEHFEIANTPQTYFDEDLVIASIDTAKTKPHKEVLETKRWDLIVIDEAHKLKNAQTQNYKLVKSLQKERCLMLTATPLQNNIFELWALLDLLHPGFLGTKQKFTNDFLADKDGLKVKNNESLQERLGKIMIRNRRADAGIVFAKRNVDTHILQYTKEELEFYNDVIGFVRKRYEEIKDQEKPLSAAELAELDENIELSADELKKMASEYKRRGILTFGLIMLTRQLTSSLKTGLLALKRFRETIEDEKRGRELDFIISKGAALQKDTKLEALLKILRGEKEKVIIFTTFIQTQKELAFELARQGLSTVLFHGQMTPEEKEAAIEEFRNDKQVLICTDAGSEGRNLQFAHILINFDLPWNPMRVEQRIGRVHRIGQKRDVIIHNLAVKDTIEGYILNRLYEKIDLFTTAIGEMDLVLSQLKDDTSVEASIFESAMTGDESLAHDVVVAKKKADSIKKFDDDLFSWRKNNGS